MIRWHLANIDSLEAQMNAQREYSETRSFELMKRWLEEYEKRVARQRQLLESVNTITQFVPASATVRKQALPPNVTQAEIVRICMFAIAWEHELDAHIWFQVTGAPESELQISNNELSEAFQQFQTAFHDQNCALVTRWLEEWNSRKARYQELVEEWLEKQLANLQS